MVGGLRHRRMRRRGSLVEPAGGCLGHGDGGDADTYMDRRYVYIHSQVSPVPRAADSQLHDRMVMAACRVPASATLYVSRP